MRRLRQCAALAGAVCASVGALGVLGAASANAGPATPPIPRGMPAAVDDVLGPADPGFWDPAVDGTRILTPVEPGVRVACATGFEPVLSCSTLDMRDVTSPQRQLGFVDAPTLGGPALRLWFDYPRWGDGSTASANDRVIDWWEQRRG